jgi:hypothetical protein
VLRLAERRSELPPCARAAAGQLLECFPQRGDPIVDLAIRRCLAVIDAQLRGEALPSTKTLRTVS